VPTLLSAERTVLRDRVVGRARAARSRVSLHCERLESRETPTASVLDPAFGAGGKVLQAPPGLSAEIAVQLDPRSGVAAAGSDATATPVGTAIDPSVPAALFSQAHVTTSVQLATTPAGTVIPNTTSTSTTKLTASATTPTVASR